MVRWNAEKVRAKKEFLLRMLCIQILYLPMVWFYCIVRFKYSKARHYGGERMPSFIRRVAESTHKAVCFFVYFSGLYHLISFLKRKKPVVLMYHSVNDRQCPYVYPDNIVSVEHFEQQIAYLSQEKNVVTLLDLVKRLRRGDDLPHNAVAITFDDGYYDFYSQAYPVLKKYDVPCTLFPITGLLCNGEAKWDDRLTHILNSTPREQVTLPLAGGEMTCDLTSQQDIHDCVEALVRILQDMDYEERSRALDAITNRVNVGDLPIEQVTLRWNDILELARDSLISFGCHTHTHRHLGKSSLEVADWEISQSKEILEQRLDRECLLFCYPFGKRNSFNPGVKKLLRAHGFMAAVTTIPGRVSKESDSFELRRIAAQDDSSYRFKGALIGLTLQRG
jgi:peptidoglycan/xylan/chitin deacetylase (PgdA/CDA1 family)